MRVILAQSQLLSWCVCGMLHSRHPPIFFPFDFLTCRRYFIPSLVGVLTSENAWMTKDRMHVVVQGWFKNPKCVCMYINTTYSRDINAKFV